MTTQLKNDLGEFSGATTYYQHGIARSVAHTDGVEYLCHNAGAYWLVDAIVSHLMTRPKVRREPFQVWELRRKKHPVDGGVILVARADTDGPVLARQDIPYSDFPRELDPFKLYVCHHGGHSIEWVIMLPSEY